MRRTRLAVGTIGGLGMLTAAVWIGVQRHCATVTASQPLPASVKFPPIITSDADAATELPVAVTNAQTSVYEAFRRLGLTPLDADHLAGQFEEIGLLPVSAYSDVMACTQIAQDCNETISDVTSAVVGAIRCGNGNASQALHIIGVLEKYARLYPRAGVWSCASQAARGENYQNQYLEVRMKTPDYSQGRLVTGKHSHVKELQPILLNLYTSAHK